MKRRLHIVCLALVTLVAASGHARAQSLDVEKVARVKAAYILNFVRYTQWPDSAFEQPDSPIVITAVGECRFGNVLSEVIRRSEPVGGRPIVLQHAPYATDDATRQLFYHSLEESHLVYVCSEGPESLETMLGHLDGTNALTVGDTPGFAERGGMIGFILDKDRIVFEASPKAIQKSHATVSAKVLKLAKIVDGDPGATP